MRTNARGSGAHSKILTGRELAFAMLAFGALVLMRVPPSPVRALVLRIAPPATSGSATEQEQWEKERAHLEGLLQNRINFYLVFSTLLLGLAVQIGDGRLKTATLLAGSLVSTVMSLSVLRTTRLVRDVLKKLCELPSHPYRVIRRSDFWNANYWLAGVVVGITICLWVLFGYFCYAGPWRFSPSPLRIEV